MSLLREEDRQAVQQRLEGLREPVQLIHFTQTLGCEYCPETRQLLEEVAALSDKVQLRVLNLQIDREEAARYDIDRVPATLVEAGGKDAGNRYLGLPSGYEFGSLLETMLLVSRGDSGLEPATRDRLAQVREPLRLDVFVTPT
jgi:alkyl hydroperoxide reductase subunit AhpF